MFEFQIKWCFFSDNGQDVMIFVGAAKMTYYKTNEPITCMVIDKINAYKYSLFTCMSFVELNKLNLSNKY